MKDRGITVVVEVWFHHLLTKFIKDGDHEVVGIRNEQHDNAYYKNVHRLKIEW